MERDMMNLARAIFAAHGGEDEVVRLSGGWSNHVFAAGGMVLRCTEHVERGRLRRETQLARLLPAEVGYPPIIDSGRTDGCDWTLCGRIAGCNLEDAWGSLSWDARADALEQLWARAKHVHALDEDAVRPFVNENLWYITTTENAAAEADLLRVRNILTADQCAAVKGYISRFEIAMQQAERVPVHGDLTPANAMWHAGKVVSLMDFECAVIAPKEADLMMLLNTAYDRGDLPEAAADPAGEARFNARMCAIVQAEKPDWDILHGYEAIKLTHHVVMDMDDEGFSPERDECASLISLLRDGKGAFAAVIS